MMLLDAFIRFSGVGLLMLLAAVTVRDLRQWQGAPYLLLASISVMAAFLGLTIEELRMPDLFHMVARLVDIPHLIFVWLFALSLFQRAFQLHWFHVWVALIYCLPILIARLYEFEFITWYPLWLGTAAEVLSVALMGHLIFATLRGRPDDLLERRRRARVYFVIVIAFVATAATLIEAGLLWSGGIAGETLWIASVWPGIAWTCYWLLGADRDALAFRDRAPDQPKVDPQEQALLATLETIMEKEEAFKEADLTITTLAKKMTVTQHRLRALINQTLGYQNFNSFINNYRIAAIKNDLLDPAKAHLPILTIAMDSGFNSLSPFNRAFRESENMTPSKFRKTSE